MEKDTVIPDFKVVIIGGSAGSLDVLMKVLPDLIISKSYALVIVLHRKDAGDMALEELISIKARIPVTEVDDKTSLLPGCIYVAPSGYHLLFEKNGLLSLDASEKINYSRPSIDVAFESAAEAFGSNAIAILLSGANADGTDGLLAIKTAGGITVVQDPETAEMSYMPQNAIKTFAPDYILDSLDMAGFINRMG